MEGLDVIAEYAVACVLSLPTANALYFDRKYSVYQKKTKCYYHDFRGCVPIFFLGQ